MMIIQIISPIVTLFLSRLPVSHSSSFQLSQRTSSPHYPQGDRASGNIPLRVSSHTLLPFLHRLCIYILFWSPLSWYIYATYHFKLFLSNFPSLLQILQYSLSPSFPADYNKVIIEYRVFVNIIYIANSYLSNMSLVFPLSTLLLSRRLSLKVPTTEEPSPAPRPTNLPVWKNK